MMSSESKGNGFFSFPKDDLNTAYQTILEFIQHTTCGHGERPWRAIGVFFAWVGSFGILYRFIPKLIIDNGLGKDSGLCFDQTLYFSIVSATTLGFGEITPDSLVLQRLVCIEVIGAIILTAVFIATLTRKFIGR